MCSGWRHVDLTRREGFGLRAACHASLQQAALSASWQSYIPKNWRTDVAWQSEEARQRVDAAMGKDSQKLGQVSSFKRLDYESRARRRASPSPPLTLMTVAIPRARI